MQYDMLNVGRSTEFPKSLLVRRSESDREIDKIAQARGEFCHIDDYGGLVRGVEFVDGVFILGPESL